MRLVSLLAVASLTLAAAAQTPATQTATQGTAATVVLQAPNAAGCPVAFAARRAGDGGLVNVDPDSARHRKQGYRITLSPTDAHSIKQARITMRGFAGPHFMEAGKTSLAGAHASESFNLVAFSGSGHAFDSTVFTSKLTGVQWVELNELTYADGTSWHASAATPCRIAPNGYMPVAAGK